MADINTKPAATTLEQPAFTVKTKDSLTVATAWTDQPYLRPTLLTRTVNGLDTASLTYESGANVRQAGGTELGPVADLDLRGKFVRISFTDAILGDFVWTGYVVNETIYPETEGPQAWTAVGLEYFLDRTQIFEAVVEDGKRLGRSIPFNDPSSANGFPVSSRGNKSSQSTTSLVPEFAAAEHERAEWTAKDILQYLVKHFHPQNDVGLPRPTDYDLDVGSYLDDYVVSFDPEGKTLFETLNALVSPRRSLCWWLEYTEAEGSGRGKAKITVASINGADITLPGGGGTLPGNIADFSLNYEDDPTVSRNSITTVSDGEYKAVRCRGARITSTFTVTHGDGYVPDWKTSIESEYQSAASSTTGYAGLGVDDKAKRNDAYRREERFYRVYCAYRIPGNWDGEVAGIKVFPDSLKTGDGSSSLTFAANWLRVSSLTMLARGTKYDVLASAEKTSPDGTADDLQPPFGIVRVADSPAKYQFIDKLGHTDYADGTPIEERFTAAFALGVQQDSPGVLIRPSNGLNHMMALNSFALAEPTATDPELDYTTLQFTISVEADHHCEAVYPAAPQSGNYSELLIDCGDNYRLDYLVPETVVRLDNGDLKKTDGGIMRDDRDQLEDIARFAFEWYSEPKRALRLTWKQMRNWFELGYLITTINDTNPIEVNTVVGEIAYDFVSLTTSITTVSDQLEIKEVI